MALTTLAKVRAYKKDPDPAKTDVLNRLITAADSYIKAYCRRTFELDAAITEYHSPKWGQTTLLVKRPPINSIASLYDDPDRAYTSGFLLASTDYVLEDADAGIIRLDGLSFGGGLNNVKITYSGGFETIPEDLEEAAIELIWLAYDKGQFGLLGQSAKNIGDGAVTLVNNNWPAHLEPILDLYRLVDR